MITGFDDVIIGLGVIADIAAYSASAYEGRELHAA